VRRRGGERNTAAARKGARGSEDFAAMKSRRRRARWWESRLNAAPFPPPWVSVLVLLAWAEKVVLDGLGTPVAVRWQLEGGD